MQQQPFVVVVFLHCHSCTDPSQAVLNRHQAQSTDRRYSPNPWVLAPSPVLSGGIQHPEEHSQQTDREEQRKSFLGFSSACKTLTWACPYLEEGCAELQPCLLLFLGRSSSPGRCKDVCNPLIQGCKTPGPWVLCDLCARHDWSGAGGTGGTWLCSLGPLGHPHSLSWAQGWHCHTQLQSLLQEQAGKMNLDQNQK